MHRRGPRPNTITYSSAISACGVAGKWQEALRLLQARARVPLALSRKRAPLALSHKRVPLALSHKR
eukprot:5784652-Pleurochrysis_carterae.AAC.1